MTLLASSRLTGRCSSFARLKSKAGGRGDSRRFGWWRVFRAESAQLASSSGSKSSFVLFPSLDWRRLPC